MRQLFSIIIFSISLIISFPVLADGLVLFSTQENAQNHCPADEVVWLNLPTGVWHTQWQKWYGATKNGAYVCKEEAMAAGDRESLRG